MVIALKLAKGGWWGGSPSNVLSASADEVMLAVQYEGFKSDYETESIRLAKEK